MNRTILYYPTIDIPKGTWLRHALLYWDEVSSIVPKDWNANLIIEPSPEIQYLIDEGQFRPINPEDLVFNPANRDVFREFKEEFISTIGSQQFQSFIRSGFSTNSGRDMRGLTISLDSAIHINKISYELFHLLKDRGLAKAQDNNDSWVLFEYHTALMYMSLLAKYLAEVDGNSTTIGTDNSGYEKFNFKRVREGMPTVGISLNNLLPSPNKNVSFETIIDFKRRRADNLINFKLIISDFQQAIAKAGSNAEFKEIVINFQDMMTKGVNDLQAVLKDGSLSYSFKTVKSLSSLQSPMILGLVGIGANEMFDVFNIPVIGQIAGLGVMAFVEISAGYVDARNEQRAVLRNSPFSYIYEAQKSNIIGRKL